MADTKISALTAAGAAADANEIPINEAGTTKKVTVAQIKTQISPVKASGAELDTGTDDAKFATAKAIKDAHNVPSVVPGTSGNVLTSNGTDWASAAAAGGGGSSPIMSSIDSSDDAAVTRYLGVSGLSASTDAACSFVIPKSGTISKLYVYSTANNLNGNTVLTIMKNGVATSITCTLAASATTGNDTANSVAVSAGDTISLRINTTASSTGAISNWRYSLLIA